MSSLVPEGWRAERLGDVSSLITKGTTPKTYTNEGVNFIKVESISTNRTLIMDKFSKVDLETHNLQKRSQLESGDILFSIAGSLGRIAVVRSEHLPANTNQALALIRLKDGDIDNAYCIQQLSAGRVQSELKNLQTVGAQPNLSLQQVSDLLINCPPLPEQKKIASILTSVDEVIENTQKQIDKLQDLKKATMNELLTKGIGHTEFKDSELGRIPKSWEVKKLKDIGDCIRGLTYSPDDIAETGLLVLRSSNIQHGRIYLGDNVFVNLDVTRKFRTQVGDLLICVRNGSRRLLGKSAIIPEGLPPSTHGAFMTVFRTPLNEYVQFLLQSEWFFTQVSRDIGATINSINNSNLLEYLFAFPTHHEQTQITNQLKSIESLIVGKSNKLSQTQSLKKSLMQDLLTGKVRVTVN
jgi:type I restriction enzyme S subunit